MPEPLATRHRLPQITDRQTWQAKIDELRVKEKAHTRKQQIVAQLLPRRVRDALRNRNQGRAQAPDLLMYAEDLSDWFFCEVKGPRDRLRDEQVRKFGLLADMTSKPVRLIEFRLD